MTDLSTFSLPISKTIDALGQPGFDACLMEFFHAICAADMCSGFALSPDGPDTPSSWLPTVLFASSRDPKRSSFARIASLKYASTYWKRDTATASSLGRAHRSVLTNRRASRIISDLDYRHECYAEGDVIERISICTAEKPMLIANAYRERRSGPFSLSEIEALEMAAPLIVSLTRRHMVSKASRRTALIDNGAVSERLRHMARPALSLREAQVLSHIASGADLGTLAAELGLSPASAATYRRRGYAKLGIRTKAALRALLSANSDMECGQSSG